MTLKEHGLGYPDLDELMNKPEPLEFIFGKNFNTEKESDPYNEETDYILGFALNR